MRAPTGNLGYEQIEVASLTDVGVRRSHNQDAFGVLLAPSLEVWKERGHIFIVADGMGAHAVGELASALAADQIPHTYQKHASLGAQQALQKAFEEANSHIHQKGQQNREFQGMGTTSTALLVRSEGAWVAHVGDSRAYRIRRNHIEQLSFDHSLRWELARRQQVTPESIAGIPSNVIVRSLGPEETVQVDIEGPHQIEPGDVYILCSDGLSNQLSDQELGAIARHLPLQEACQFLVDLANLRGGPDNITVVSVRVPGEPEPENAADLKSAKGNRKWYQIIPWPALAITLGACLAILALIMSTDRTSNLQVGGMAIFGVSVAIVLAGLIGVFLQRRKEQKEEEQENVNSSLQIYRRSPIQVDAALINKLMQTEANLLELIREKGWNVEENKLKQLQGAVALHLKKNELIPALQKQCQSLSFLTTKLRQHRTKDEQFKPNW